MGLGDEVVIDSDEILLLELREADGVVRGYSSPVGVVEIEQ